MIIKENFQTTANNQPIIIIMKNEIYDDNDHPLMIITRLALFANGKLFSIELRAKEFLTSYLKEKLSKNLLLLATEISKY